MKTPQVESLKGCTPLGFKEEKNHSKEQAEGQLQSIKELVSALNDRDDKGYNDAVEAIQQDPLSIEVRSGWHTPGQEAASEEFRILICWGGPACRIVGELNEHGEPERACLQYQDWGTPWKDYPLTVEEEQAVLTYCQQFYFGE